MRPRIGPSRCGELADVILDQEGIHTAEGRPRLVSLPAEVAGSYASCRAALGHQPDRSVIEIPTSTLRAGREFCVRTDLGNIALVRIDDLSLDSFGDLERMTISFTTWPAE